MAWEISVAILISTVIGGLLYVVKILDKGDEEDMMVTGVRLLCLLISLWLMVLGTHTAQKIAEGATASADVQTTLGTLYVVMLVTVVTATGFFIIQYIIALLKYFRALAEGKQRKILRGE